ncbi:unnamed protein product [Withania somnifera]
MRPNIVSEAGLQTRMGQWWVGIPIITSAVVVVCGIIYLVCLLVGYDSFGEVCFWPSAVISRFEVYRIFTSILFHGSLLHVLFNMLALVPLGSELERIMGSVRLSYIIVLLAVSNALLHLLIALLVAYNPFHPYPNFMDECAIGFSGILFSMIVMETSLSGAQTRSVFGLFNVPAKWYALILLVVFQIVMTNVSLLGHLCGILSGFAYTYGLFNVLIPGTSFFSAIESSSWLSTCVRRPKFIMCTGGNGAGYLPTHSNQTVTSSGVLSGNIWENLSSWMPQRENSAQPLINDSRFPGRGRTLSTQATTGNHDSTLQARLLDGSSSPEHISPPATIGGDRSLAGRLTAVDTTATATATATRPLGQQQGSTPSDEKIQKLAAMGFEKTQVEVALAAAEGDLNVAVEILMSQQG